jgi:hypothetical protein
MKITMHHEIALGRVNKQPGITAEGLSIAEM